MVFSTFFNLSLNFAIRSSWSSHCQLPVLFLLTVWSFFIFGCKECNQSYFGIDHLMMSMCRVFSWVVGRGCLLWLVHSLGNTLLAFALLHFVFQGQTCLLLQISLDFLLLHSILLWCIEHLLLVLVLGGLDSILKSREITLTTKVYLATAIDFPVVMYGWQSWTIKKTEHQRIDAFELWCWRRLLRVHWTARRSSQ